MLQRLGKGVPPALQVTRTMYNRDISKQHGGKKMFAKIMATGAILGALAGGALATHSFTATTASTVPHVAVQEHVTAPKPSEPTPHFGAPITQTGDTCFANASSYMLNAYGIHESPQTVGELVYTKGWTLQSANKFFSDTIAYEHVTTHDVIGPITAKQLEAGPAIVSVFTQKLAWWKPSESQGAHEIAVLGMTSNGDLKVMDSAWGSFEYITPQALAAAAYAADFITN